MVSVKYRFVCGDRDRHGNMRYYFRRKGLAKVRLPSAPDTPDFATAYQVALSKGTSDLTISCDPFKPPARGTYRWLCVQYFASSKFGQLEDRTQKVRRQVLEKTFDEPIAPGATETFGACPLSKISRKAIDPSGSQSRQA